MVHSDTPDSLTTTETQPIWNASFYRFVALPDYQELRPLYLERCQELGLLGTILLAAEGINATISGSREALEALITFFDEDPRLAGITPKYSVSPTAPFARLKVRLKREIVTLGRPEEEYQTPTGRPEGQHVRPEDWNALISDPEVVVLDTRNLYETSIGSFKGAQDPHTQSFREFPEYVNQTLDPDKHKRVAMFCTGGIRCEKASAWMLAQGFEQVYQLDGGILKYLETVPPEESLWEGECFVFDERVAVNHQLDPGRHSLCVGCGGAVSPEDMQHPAYEPGVSCPACAQQRTEAQKIRHRQIREQQIRAQKLRQNQP